MVTLQTRPWGGFQTFYKDDDTTVKILTVNPRSAISLQAHDQRDEFWTLLTDSVVVLQIGSEVLTAEVGMGYSVPRQTLHRISNYGAGAAQILEVAKGHFDEADIIRFEDMYGRT
jgi:mannose-6-phosphate isomerase-like protein (cupin superfamily)